MPRNFSPAAWKEPRILLRAVIGALLAANLAAAIIAFKPFGGSAEDLRRDEAALSQQLTSLRDRVAKGKLLVSKMQNARKDTDQFLTKYVTDEHFGASTLYLELDRIATEAGVKPLPVTYNEQDIEGSDGMKMVSVTEGCEGTYANLAKFINLLDKSPRFLIIENLTTNAPQQNGGALNVQIKIDTFMNHADVTP
jgi:type IV pilus assembly protein PilO